MPSKWLEIVLVLVVTPILAFVIWLVIRSFIDWATNPPIVAKQKSRSNKNGKNNRKNAKKKLNSGPRG